MRSPEDDDSEDDDSEGEETFGQNKLALEHQHRMLQTPPALSAKKNRSNVLTPMNSKNDDNTPHATPRRMSQTTHKLQATSQAQGENIDPKQGQGSGRKTLLPKLVVQKPDYDMDNEEEVVMDKSVSIPSDSIGEIMVGDGATHFVDSELGTLFVDAYKSILDAVLADTGADSLKLTALQKWHNSPPKVSSPARSPPLSAPSQQGYAQLPRPVDKSHLTPGTSRLRHLDWLSSDSIDDADDESIEIPTGHSSRLKKAQAQRILDETAFLGGDEASAFVGDTSMNNEVFDMLRRKDLAGEGNVSFEESGLAAMSKEHPSTSPAKLILSGTAHVALSSDTETIRGSTGGAQNSQFTYDGAGGSGEGDIQPSVLFSELKTQQKTANSDDQLKSVVSMPFAQGPVGQFQVPDTTVVEELGSSSITPAPLGIMPFMEAGSSAGSLSRETTVPAPELIGGETLPQYFIRALNNTDKTARPASSSGLSSRPSFALDAIVRPKTSPEDLQENSTAAALKSSPQNLFQGSPKGDIEGLTEINPQNSFYPEAFVAQSTPKDYYGGYDLWDIKKSGRGRRVSMNTPPSTLGRSLSGSDILNNPPELSSLGSGFSFPSQPLRYQEWDPESVAREFTPPFPVEGVDGVRRMGLRLQGVDAPHNTPTPAVGKGSGPPVGWQQGKGVKEGKGRVRSKSDPVENKVAGGVGKVLFTSARVEQKRVEIGSGSGGEGGKEEHGDPQGPSPSLRPRDTISGIREKSGFSDESELPVGDDAAQDDEIHNGVDLDDDDLDLRFVIFFLIF